MPRRIMAASVLSLALIAACGGDDDGAGTPTADPIEDCLSDVDGHNLERTPADPPVGYGADVEFIGQTTDGGDVSIFVAEGDTDPQAVYVRARDGEAQRRQFLEETGEADEPGFVEIEVVRRGDAVVTFAEDVDAEIRRELE